MSHARLYEISGQCSVCQDFFSVTISFVSGQPLITPTARLQWQGDTLIHRPGLCNGKVTLYGKLPEGGYAHHILSRTTPKTTYQ